MMMQLEGTRRRDVRGRLGGMLSRIWSFGLSWGSKQLED